MSGLKYFNKDSYDSLGDALTAIRQELRSLCPKDSANVKWKRGADGMSISLGTQQAGSSAESVIADEVTSSSKYNGYFTLKDVSTYNEDGTVREYRVAVCDGESWDAETEKSALMGLDYGNTVGDFSVSIESKVFSLTRYASFYIKHGPNSNYINQIIAYIDGNTPDRVFGYTYTYIGSASVDSSGVLRINQILKSPYVPHPKFQNYYGDFSIIGLETADGTPIENKYAVCNGMTWDAHSQKGGKSRFYVNGWEHELDSTIVEVDLAHTSLYINYVGANSFKIVTYEELPDDSWADEYGYMHIYGGYARANFGPIMFNIYRRVCNK